MSQSGPSQNIQSSISVIETLTGNTGGAVSPDGSNNINVLGNNASGINVVGNPATNTLTIVGSTAIPLTFDGDTGSATAAANVITFNANTLCGNTVSFSGSGSTMSLNVSNTTNFNTLIGFGSGNGTPSGGSNTGVGFENLFALSTGTTNSAYGFSSLTSLQSGSSNTGIGYNAIKNITTGSFNIGLGYTAGQSYTLSDSSNISIGNTGSAGESNVIRIGTNGSGSGQQNKCFIAGIDGINVGSVAKVLTMASNQVGTATITAGSGIAVTPGANTITIAATGAGFTWTDVTGSTQTIVAENGYLADRAGGVAFTLPASGTIGDTFRIVGVQGSWTLAQNANQQIKYGSAATTVGVGGSLASTNAGDCIECVATNTSASTVWRVMSSVGNITVV